jgi:hypothetical protein
MMPISSRFRELSLLSPRTAEYVEAMIREGDSFDYSKWLKSVREEQAQAKQVPTAFTPRNVVAARADNSINTSASRDARPSLGPALINKRLPSPRALRWPHRQAESQTPKARLRRWLQTVRLAWEDFQASRARDAVYGYLEAVFEIVMHYKVRRRTNRLLRHAFEFANLPFDKNADTFSAVIRCTSERDIDNKMISKYARALRYVRYCKTAQQPLKKFMTASGGVNACADRYAKLMRRV